MTTTTELSNLLRIDGSEINVPRALSTDECAALLDAGLIEETDAYGDEETRADYLYRATDYARDLIWHRA